MNSEAVWCRACLVSLVAALAFMGPARAIAAPKAQSSQRAERCRVTSVEVAPLAGEGSEVLIVTSREPDYGARIEQSGKRLVIDLRDALVAGAEPALTDSRGVVGGVMTQGFRAQGADTVRVLVQLMQPAAYRLVPSPTGLRVVLQPAEKTAPMKAQPAAAKEQQAVATVRGVRFERGSDGDHVIVALEGAAGFAVTSRAANRSVLELRGVTLDKTLERTADVSAFGGVVRAVSTYAADGAVMIDVDHADGATGHADRRGDELHFVLAGAGAEGRPPSVHFMDTGVGPDGGAARRSKSVAAESLGPLEEGLYGERIEPDQAGAFLPQLAPMQQRQRFAGRRIDLDLKDADIHNVFRLIADVGNINIVAADNVEGTVTIRMKNVPWDQALDTVLQAKKLGMVRTGNIIRVALMADLNKERELAIARRVSELQLEPIETRLIPVSYASAEELQPRAKDLLSPRGTLAVDQRTNVLIARDVRGNLNQMEELIRALDTQTPQVLIEARIVEATSRFQRDVGIQWGGDLFFGPATANETGLAFPSSVGVVGGASDTGTPTAGLSPIAATVPNPNFAINLPATVGTGAGGALGLTLGSIDNTVNLAVRLSAAETTGMVRIVSSPRILTLDNSEARIAQGTLIPFSQVSAQGVQTVFQEAKLQLLVVPHVTADGSISMHVRINRDEPDFTQTSARGDPTILKREAETELLVRDGHTAVIGGIYTRNTGRSIDQVPLLGDIPILGVLFQRRRASDARGELVIFVTPRIVNRAEALGR